MNKNSIKSIAFILSLAIVFPLNAQTIFDIEFVFFKRIDRQEGLNYLALENLEVLESEFDISQLEPIIPENYQVLEGTDRKLEGIFKRLKSSANIRPLLHFAWRQPLLNKDETQWLSFKLEDDADQKGLLEFLGALRFSRNQGLLVETHIIGSRHSTPEDSETAPEGFTQEDAENDVNKPAFSDEEFAEMQRPDELEGNFLLDKSSKVKLNELTYFDHPSMGLLLKVTPYIATFEEQQALDNNLTPDNDTDNLEQDNNKGQQ